MRARLNARLLAVAVLSLCAVWAPSAAAKIHFGVAKFTVHGSAEQVDVTGANPGALLELVNRNGVRVQSGRVDSLGGLLYRNVKPGAATGCSSWPGAACRSQAFTVLSDRSAPPSTEIYTSGFPPAATAT